MSDMLTPQAMAERTDMLHRTIPKTGDFLTMRDFCRMMGMDSSSVKHLIRRYPTFPVNRVGQKIYVIRRSELRNWLDNDPDGMHWRYQRMRASRWTNPII